MYSPSKLRGLFNQRWRVTEIGVCQVASCIITAALPFSVTWRSMGQAGENGRKFQARRHGGRAPPTQQGVARAPVAALGGVLELQPARAASDGGGAPSAPPACHSIRSRLAPPSPHTPPYPPTSPPTYSTSQAQPSSAAKHHLACSFPHRCAEDCAKSTMDSSRDGEQAVSSTRGHRRDYSRPPNR